MDMAKERNGNRMPGTDIDQTAVPKPIGISEQPTNSTDFSQPGASTSAVLENEEFQEIEQVIDLSESNEYLINFTCEVYEYNKILKIDKSRVQLNPTEYEWVLDDDKFNFKWFGGDQLPPSVESISILHHIQNIATFDYHIILNYSTLLNTVSIITEHTEEDENEDFSSTNIDN
ncbi:hypothetical protein FQR65_LT09785 [Abscondita terminalis]|nr:hypothetical protein FQR65_LT09785 [Abscondita terminalis]